MGEVEAKSSGVRCLLEAVHVAYGQDAFQLDEGQPDDPEHVVLTSARDRRFAASVIALPERPGCFSVMIELHGKPEPQLIPFEIVEDGEFSPAEVVALLGRYRDWQRRDSAAGNRPFPI